MVLNDPTTLLTLPFSKIKLYNYKIKEVNNAK
jgi:hypothetical protein